AGPFTLVAKADRIERRRDGSLVIVDYKTGSVPSWTDVGAGLAPQLPLEAVIAEAGGFAGLAAAPVAGLAYWRVTGSDPPGVIQPLRDGQLSAVVQGAEAGVRALIARFDDPATGYPSRPRPELAPAYSDYLHLARVKEWS